MPNLSNEKRVVLLSCSRLALPEDGKPFASKEFSSLIDSVQGGVETLGKLLGARADTIKSETGLPDDTASRLSILMDADRSVDGELERLASLGIWVLVRGEGGYPSRYLNRLGKTAPWVLFGSGAKSLLERGGLAVVGSRNVDDTGTAFAGFLGSAAAASGMVLCSGAARGVDQVSMRAAIASGGRVAGVLADSLVRAVKSADTRNLLEDERLVLITPYAPDAPFSVGTAMGRNKLIYCLADHGVVVASDAETGGTWAGAVEALKAGWTPVFVGEYSGAPDGNKRLISKGGIPIPHPFEGEPSMLLEWVSAKGSRTQRPRQQDLF